MNNKLMVIGLGIVIFVGGVLFMISNAQKSSVSVSESVLENTKLGGRTPDQTDVNVTEYMKEGVANTPQNVKGKYVTYSPAAFAAAANSKRVYYFHAPWCPTCKVVNAEFESNPDKIPAGVVVFKTDYDTNGDLKKKYGVTYQHTFVQVDAAGNEITKWNGGGIAELVANIR